MAKLLGSDQGQFPTQNVRRLTDTEATASRIIEAIESTFSTVKSDDSVFVYLAEHGAAVGSDYYFIAYDTDPADVVSKGVPLKKIKASFDASPSQRVFLWLDFCQSGGIIPRDLTSQDDKDVIERTLKVAQGRGKLIVAACTPEQSAYESTAVGHGLFTDALLKGMKGEAASQGEVTVNSLYDYIDRKMGSDRQRPMMFGEMTGRIVLMHVS